MQLSLAQTTEAGSAAGAPTDSKELVPTPAWSWPVSTGQAVPYHSPAPACRGFQKATLLHLSGEHQEMLLCAGSKSFTGLLGKQKLIRLS